MKIAEDIFAYSSYCYLAKWVSFCCEIGLFGSFFSFELFGESGRNRVGMEETVGWFIHLFIHSWIHSTNIKKKKKWKPLVQVCDPKEAWDPWIHTKGWF